MRFSLPFCCPISANGGLFKYVYMLLFDKDDYTPAGAGPHTKLEVAELVQHILFICVHDIGSCFSAVKDPVLSHVHD